MGLQHVVYLSLNFVTFRNGRSHQFLLIMGFSAELNLLLIFEPSADIPAVVFHQQLKGAKNQPVTLF